MNVGIPLTAARLAFLAGIVLGAGSLLMWQVEGGDVEPPAKLALASTLARDLTIEPADTELASRKLRPSAPEDGVVGAMTARNATGRPLSVRVRAMPETGDLDRAVAVHLRAGAQMLFSGPLVALRRGTKAPFILDRDASITISMRAWIPEGADAGWQARSDKVVLELVTRPVRTT